MTFTDASNRRWRVLHANVRRDLYTCVRDRRFFSGRPRMFTGLLVRVHQERALGAAGVRVAQRAVVGL